MANKEQSALLCVKDSMDCVMKLLSSCPHIKLSAQWLAIPPADILKITHQGTVKFRLDPILFNVWLHNHESHLGVHFRKNSTGVCLKSKWKWQNDHYLCNHFGTKRGAKQQGQEQVEGEESKGEEYEEDMDEEQEDTEEEDESDEECHRDGHLYSHVSIPRSRYSLAPKENSGHVT